MSIQARLHAEIRNVISTLIELLHDPDEDVQEASAKALSKLAKKGKIPHAT